MSLFPEPALVFCRKTYVFRNKCVYLHRQNRDNERKIHILRFDTVAFHNRHYRHYHNPSGLRHFLRSHAERACKSKQT